MENIAESTSGDGFLPSPTKLKMTNKQIIEELEKITDEYGQLHETNCDLNAEGGSYNGCNCAMKSLVKEIGQLFSDQKQQILTLIKEKNKSDNVIENYNDIIKEIEEL